MLTLTDATDGDLTMRINPVDIVVVRSTTDDEDTCSSKTDTEYSGDRQLNIAFTEEVEVTHVEVPPKPIISQKLDTELEDNWRNQKTKRNGESNMAFMRKYISSKRKVIKQKKNKPSAKVKNETMQSPAKSKLGSELNGTPKKSNRMKIMGVPNLPRIRTPSKQKIIQENMKFSQESTHDQVQPLEVPILHEELTSSVNDHRNENRKIAFLPQKTKPRSNSITPTPEENYVTNNENITMSPVPPTHKGCIPLNHEPGSSSFSDLLCNTALSFAYEDEITPRSSIPSLQQDFSQISYSPNYIENKNESKGDQLRKRYKPYFEKADFLVDNWATASEMERAPVYGMALLVATTVIVHPIVFFAGAATAVWAVGTFHAVEQGYEFFTDGSFTSLFWDDKDEMKLGSRKALLQNGKESADENKTSLSNPMEPLDPISVHENKTSKEDNQSSLISTPTYVNKPVQIPLSSRSHETATTSMSPSSYISTSSKDSILTLSKLSNLHFPPLEIQVVKQVPFPGLNAEEFFEVFFSDDAPYSYKEFQKTRGDIDIEFGEWNKAEDKSFMCENTNNRDLTSLPNSLVKERTSNFKTLTKSYFGPTYGNATKLQRMTKIQDKLLVLEGRTKLSDIPFSDRFYVDERWVIAPKNDHNINDKNHMYSSELSVYLEIKFVQSCKFEAQIRKKTLSTMTEMVNAWCKQATAALVLAEKERMKREKHAYIKSVDSIPTLVNETTISSLPSLEINEVNINAHSKSPKISLENGDQINIRDREELLNLHKSKLNALEKKIVAGSIDDLGIEVYVLDPENDLKLNKGNRDIINRQQSSPVKIVEKKPSKPRSFRNMKGKSKKIFSRLKSSKSSQF